MSEQKIINAAVVGIGRIGRNHGSELASFPDKFRITACADHAPDRLDSAPECFKNARKYLSLEELLKDSEIDLVTIGTRHPDHIPMALKVLETGRSVLIEKPVATSVKEFDLLVEAAKDHPERVFFRQQRRWEPAFVKAQALVKSGIIGEPQYFKLCRCPNYCRRNDWMTMTEFYGGLFTNWGPHIIDQALRYIDSPVKDLWADIRRVISIGDGDDLMKIILKGENNRYAEVEISGANLWPGRELEIIGSRGTLVYEGGATIKVRHLDPCVQLKDQKPHPENPPLAYGNPEDELYFVNSEFELPKEGMSVMWKYLYNTMTKGEPYPITMEQERQILTVIEKALEFSGFEPIRKFRSKLL